MNNNNKNNSGNIPDNDQKWFDIVKNPHDKLFKLIFSKKEVLIDFLKNNLPDNLRDNLDFATLVIEKESFIEENLTESQSDILITIQYNKFPVNIYLLFEHKSYKDKFTLFQTLKYMLKIYDRQIKDNPSTKIAPVIPIIYYHGKEKLVAPCHPDIATPGSAVSHENTGKFSDIFKYDDILLNYIPRFDYVLHDLRGLKENEIKGQLILKITELLFKYSPVAENDPESRKKIFEIMKMFKDLLEEENSVKMLNIFIRYLLSATNINKDEIIENFNNIKFKKGGNTVVSTAELLIEKGRKEGIDKGYIKGKIEVAKELLKNGISLDIIEKSTGLGKDKLKKILV